MLIILDNCIYFSNLATSLYNILRKHTEVLICNSIISLDDTYIIFNIKDLETVPNKYIVYNFEQLDTTNNFENDFWSKLNNAIQVWDYSKVNIEYLLTKDINAIFVPFGWNVTMKILNILPFDKRINNVMFIGYINERRRNILKPVHTLCKEHNYTMFLSNECWNEDYNHKLSISKIALNIHCYNGKTILEVHRIIPYILNKIWVISERSQDPYYDNLFDGLVTWVDDINMFASQVYSILNTDTSVIEQVLKDRQRLLIERCSYSIFINNCLKDKIMFL